MNVLARLAALAERIVPVPGWAALPVLVTLGSLGVAAFGFFWDVGTHIDSGRDSGPFANVAHYPILAGLGGIALAGFLAAVLGADARDRAAIEWAPGWRIPLGGALLLLCGAVAMLGFPLDDVWHRIFGQDVTLWGPTHVLMIGGASLAPIAAWLLLIEGRRAAGRAQPGRTRLLAWEVQLAGATLIGLSTLQLEFGFGVPQFQLAFHPILIALAASVALVAARLRLGRGGALAATGAYLVIMTPLVLIVGPLFGHTFLHFPLYLVEAALVELAGARARPPRPGVFGAIAGALIGTVGRGGGVGVLAGRDAAAVDRPRCCPRRRCWRCSPLSAAACSARTSAARCRSATCLGAARHPGRRARRDRRVPGDPDATPTPGRRSAPP